jgi:hypothetical protein
MRGHPVLCVISRFSSRFLPCMRRTRSIPEAPKPTHTSTSYVSVSKDARVPKWRSIVSPAPPRGLVRVGPPLRRTAARCRSFPRGEDSCAAIGWSRRLPARSPAYLHRQLRRAGDAGSALCSHRDSVVTGVTALLSERRPPGPIAGQPPIRVDVHRPRTTVLYPCDDRYCHPATASDPASFSVSHPRARLMPYVPGCHRRTRSLSNRRGAGPRRHLRRATPAG